MLRKILFSNWVSAILFIELYRFLHIHYLVAYFGYMGYENCQSSWGAVLITNLLAFFPILCYSTKAIASNFISILIYVLIYVPTVVTLQYKFIDYLYVFPYQMAFLFSMVSFFLCVKVGDNTQKKAITSINSISKCRIISTRFVVGVGLFFTLLVLIGFGGSLRLVSLKDVYELRDENHASLSKIPLLGYLVLWLTYFFIPFFAAIGFYSKRNFYKILSFAVAFLIYSATGAKAALFSPFFAIGLYYVLRKYGFKYLFQIIVLVFGIIVFAVVLSDGVNNSFTLVLGSVLLMRTFGIAGLITPSYLLFFDNHSYTYFRHIGVVGQVFGKYEHGGALGKVVWGEYVGLDADFAANANANFLLTDGLAAMGIFGILIITLLFCLLLVWINRISARHNSDFVFVLLIGSVMALANVSLFTSLLSCGMLLIILYLKYSTPDFEL